MLQNEVNSARTHDLLEVDPERFLSLHAPASQWVVEELRRVPFLVVRRGLASGQTIPVGVRGPERNQRWAGFCKRKLVKTITTPPQLLKRNVPMLRAESVPAFSSLLLLKERWIGFDYSWGPGGSIGFELATGSHVAKLESDLDIVIYINEPITPDQAKSLCTLASGLPTAVDIRVETRTYGFSLKEYASQGAAPILLRTPYGVRFGSVSWDESEEPK